MNFKQSQQVSNIAFWTVLAFCGLVLILGGVVIRESRDQTIMGMEDNIIQGYRISKPLDLRKIKNVAESKIEWEAETEEGVTNVIIQVAITDSNSEIPQDWIEAVNGEPIPDINKGNDLRDKYLWTKQILQTNNPEITPRLYSLTETILMRAEAEGYRTSPEFNISGPYTVKNSQIFWRANERFDGDIKVKIMVSTSGEWNEVVNGAIIPGLEPETSLAGVRIQTKTFFVGGPDFYPSLEDIKIFIESEE